MSDAIIEAAARAMCNRHFPGKWDVNSDASHNWYRDLARSSLAAVTPLIRAEALEEAAQVAEDEDGEFWYAGEHRNMVMLQQHGFEIAAAIRALKERP